MIFTAIKKNPAILSIDWQSPILVHSRSHGRGGRDPKTVNYPASVEHPESRSRWGRDGKEGSAARRTWCGKVGAVVGISGLALAVALSARAQPEGRQGAEGRGTSLIGLAR
jgi:hypothetical protein